MDDLLHDDIEAAIAFDGVPIGISDGLAELLHFYLSHSRVSDCPGLENALGAADMLLVPNRKYFDSPA